MCPTDTAKYGGYETHPEDGIYAVILLPTAATRVDHLLVTMVVTHCAGDKETTVSQWLIRQI